jgi:hypothetical protein
MRRIIVLLLASTATLSSVAADPAGRWTGTAQVPGRDIPLVVDLAKDDSGAWIGSLVVPGFYVKGAPLGNLKVAGDDLTFDAGDALGAAPNNATFTAHLGANGLMTGEFRQAGNVATLALKRAGAAQVDVAKRSTAVSHDAEGRWVGEYEMAGYPRHVTVDIANRAGSPANVDFVVVGKATTKLPIDYVGEQEGMLRIESRAYGFTFEGRVHGADGRIVGTLEVGPFELPFTLRREGKTS